MEIGWIDFRSSRAERKSCMDKLKKQSWRVKPLGFHVEHDVFTQDVKLCQDDKEIEAVGESRNNGEIGGCEISCEI